MTEAGSSLDTGGILLVSGDGDLADELKVLLADIGHAEVGVAGSRRKALDQLAAGAWDLVILYVPDRARKTWIRTASSIFREHGTPLVIVADRYDPALAADIKPARPCGFLARPIDRNALAVEMTLAFHRAGVRREFMGKEDMYRMLVENSVEVIWSFSPSGGITYVSPSVVEMLGFTPEEATRMSMEDFFTPESYAVVRSHLERDMAASPGPGSHVKDLELQIRRRDGSVFWGLASIRLIRDNAGRVTGFQGNVRDIDRRKRLEERYMSFVDSSSYGFVMLDAEGRITFANSRALEISGYGPEAMGAIHFSDMIVEEDLSRAAETLKARARGEVGPSIYRLKRKDGGTRTVEANMVPIRERGKVVGYHGTVIDISEMEDMHRALREKSDFLDAVVGNTSDGIFVIDEDMKYAFINPAAGRIVGHEPDQWLGKRAGTYRHPDDEKAAMEAILKVLGGEPASCEIRVMHSDGEYRLLNIRYTLMMMGDKPHILGVVSDVTESRAAENAIRESERKYRALFENSPEQIALLDGNGRVLEANRAMCNYFGISPEDIKGAYLADLADLDENAGRLLAGMLSGSADWKDYVEMTWRSRGNELRWMEVLPTHLETSGRERSVQLIARDITERKRAEMEVRKRHLSFDMEPGNLYLCRSRELAHGTRAFGELVMIGYEGVVLSRRPRRSFKARIRRPFVFLRVAEAGGAGTVRPARRDIIDTIGRLHRGHVILIDCLDYLVGVMGPKRTIRLVQYLKDMAAARGHILIARSDPDVLDDRTLRMLESESADITPARSLRRISPKLLDVLNMVAEFEAKGECPSYTELGTDLGMSKPTLRSRVRQLKDMGALREGQRGRRKELELTDTGRAYLAL